MVQGWSAGQGKGQRPGLRAGPGRPGQGDARPRQGQGTGEGQGQGKAKVKGRAQAQDGAREQVGKVQG